MFLRLFAFFTLMFSNVLMVSVGGNPGLFQSSSCHDETKKNTEYMVLLVVTIVGVIILWIVLALCDTQEENEYLERYHLNKLSIVRQEMEILYKSQDLQYWYLKCSLMGLLSLYPSETTRFFALCLLLYRPYYYLVWLYIIYEFSNLLWPKYLEETCIVRGNREPNVQISV